MIPNGAIGKGLVGVGSRKIGERHCHSKNSRLFLVWYDRRTGRIRRKVELLLGVLILTTGFPVPNDMKGF